MESMRRDFPHMSRVLFDGTMPVALLVAFAFAFALAFAFVPQAFAVKAMPGSGVEYANRGCPSHTGEVITLDSINASDPSATGVGGAVQKIRAAANPEQKTMPLLMIVVGLNDTPYSDDLNWSTSIFNGDSSLIKYYLDMSLDKFTFRPAVESSATGVGGQLE